MEMSLNEGEEAVKKIGAPRRSYFQWVNNETLEDYALRFTPIGARKSIFSVGNAALGALSFLACEAIGGATTLTYGFANTIAAICSICVLMFLCGAPIAYYAVKNGVDMDLLTRGAGFGYLGSTFTSLIYASFTFLLFAIEASIMSEALRMAFHIPLWLAHIVSAAIVVPIAMRGMTSISRMQMATQPFWLILQFAPLAYLIICSRDLTNGWAHFPGADGKHPVFDWAGFGAASSFLISLLPQIGEQVDYLRFLPERSQKNNARWWATLILTGPGWVLIGGLKIIFGSFLAYCALSQGFSAAEATQPAVVYNMALTNVFGSSALALIATGFFVSLCQIKINVTNAYAGSIAWSNFFSRLTHSHPGRVVWLLFNALIALVLMEAGVFEAVSSILVVYANFAAGWIGALVGDLAINKPLKLSPPPIEFKRSQLSDLNPVGVGALGISLFASTLSGLGAFGEGPKLICSFIGLCAAFISAPLIAYAVRGRFSPIRNASLPEKEKFSCIVCENIFERPDMAHCPVYEGTICSLCCTLENQCGERCKPGMRLGEQLRALARAFLPKQATALLEKRNGQFAALALLFCGATAGILTQIYFAYGTTETEASRLVIRNTLWIVFCAFAILSSIAAWFLVLAHNSRRLAEDEKAKHEQDLIAEIKAHETTLADLQTARDAAERANLAKSRYIIGLSHEIRTPLNAISGYAQLLQRAPDNLEQGLRTIQNNAEHLASLVDGLLDISRIETGVLHLDRERILLKDFFDQIASTFQLHAAAKGLTFIYEAAQSLPVEVEIDAKRLRQILINLLSNAIKYTEKGRVELRIGFRADIATIEVSDTGIGIAASDQERIFHAFERGADPVARQQPGTGLGLTITRLLTQILGGSLTLRSAPGQGSAFMVRLHLSEAFPQDKKEVATIGAVAASARILVVDDDANHIDVIRKSLAPFGFDLAFAFDGAEALRLARNKVFDIALLDLNLPDTHGFKLASDLRKLFSDIAIIIISANADQYREGGDVGAPYDAFLFKPLNIDILIQTIARFLIRKGNGINLNQVQTFEPPASLNRYRLELLQLCRIGYARGIEAKLDEWSAADPHARAYVENLRGMLKRFELKKLMDYIGSQ